MTVVAVPSRTIGLVLLSSSLHEENLFRRSCGYFHHPSPKEPRTRLTRVDNLSRRSRTGRTRGGDHKAGKIFIGGAHDWNSYINADKSDNIRSLCRQDQANMPPLSVRIWHDVSKTSGL